MRTRPRLACRRMRSTLEQVFDVPAERLWALYFFDEAHGRALSEHLGLRVLDDQLQHEGAGPRLIVRRQLRVVSQRELPPVLRRLVSGALVMQETGEFNAERRRYSVRIELPLVGGLVECGSDFTWDNLPGGQMRRLWEGCCTAKVPLVGARIERAILGELAATIARSHAFTSRWLRDHPEAPVVAGVAEAAPDHGALKAL
jgi:hypothetical protein